MPANDFHATWPIWRGLAKFLALSVAGAIAVIGLYIVKSWLGLDLLDGPSFMHAYFYWR